MLQRVSWIIGLFILVAGIGPLTFVATHLGKRDKADIYLVLGTTSHGDLAQTLTRLDAWEIGPEPAFFGRLIYAPPTAHVGLRRAEFILLPAGMLAAFCGVQVVHAPPKRRDKYIA